MAEYTVVPATDLARIAASGATILDVRTQMEHDAQRLNAPHELVPLDQLNPDDFMLRRGLDAEAPVYMLCKAGGRARKAAALFAAAGYKNTYVIDGGITACDPAATTGAAAPATRAKLSIEEQVRLIAGSAIIIGLFLGLVVKNVFFLIPFLAGAGLAYSGATGDCRLALLLARAPWNKSANVSCNLPKTPGKPTAGGCA